MNSVELKHKANGATLVIFDEIIIGKLGTWLCLVPDKRIICQLTPLDHLIANYKFPGGEIAHVLQKLKLFDEEKFKAVRFYTPEEEKSPEHERLIDMLE